ncbi:hypothetical protein [Pseudomonas aeruginosa]|uniref:hypothetical protein n=1 Tax=Pseudomonas aeruginosa TaxID=287 RepID=UPI003CC5C9C0
MEYEVSLEIDGVTYIAICMQHGDELVVFFPDGTERRTTLRELDPEHAAKSHLRGYIHALKHKG